jgi:hypothetical protein
VFVESCDFKFVGSVGSVGAGDVDRIVGWEFVGVFDEIAQISHEELEVWHFVFFIQGNINQTHVDGFLNDGLDDTKGDDFLDTAVAFLVEFFGEFSTVLWPGLKSKLHECLKSFGDSIGKLEVSDNINKVHGDIAIRI